MYCSEEKAFREIIRVGKIERWFLSFPHGKESIVGEEGRPSSCPSLPLTLRWLISVSRAKVTNKWQHKEYFVLKRVFFHIISFRQITPPDQRVPALQVSHIDEKTRRFWHYHNNMISLNHWLMKHEWFGFGKWGFSLCSWCWCWCFDVDVIGLDNVTD